LCIQRRQIHFAHRLPLRRSLVEIRLVFGESLTLSVCRRAAGPSTSVAMVVSASFIASRLVDISPSPDTRGSVFLRNASMAPKNEPTADNPPNGAIVDYALPEHVKGPVTLTVFDAQNNIECFARHIETGFRPAPE
jgi:hypothetical protein